MSDYFFIVKDLTGRESCDFVDSDFRLPIGHFNPFQPDDPWYRISLLPGKPWKENMAYPVYTHLFDMPPCDLSSITGGYMISEKIKSVFEQFNAPAQYFDVNVEVKGRPYTKTRYYHMHHLCVVDYIDYEHSSLEMDAAHDGSITDIHQLTLDMSKLNNIDVCTIPIERDGGLYKKSLISKRVKDVLAEQDLKGVILVPSEELTVKGEMIQQGNPHTGWK